MSAQALGVQLADCLTAAWDGPVSVLDLHRLSGGASMETWLATTDGPSGKSRVIVRRDRPGVSHSSLAVEARVLRAAHAAGVPVAEVLAESTGDGPPFLVMAYLEGETIPRRLLRDEAYSAAREALVEQVGAALAGTHAVPAADVAFLGPAQTPAKALAALTAALRAHDVDSPVLELALRWLADRLPAPTPPVLVHGDLRTGNLMVGPEGLVAVLDWELAHTGQALEDLGWFCARAWRFGADDRPAGGFGDRAALVDAYVRAGGALVDPADLRFWEVFATLRWAVTCLAQVAVHLRGDVRSVELAAIGRRLGEAEYDLVLLLREDLGAAAPSEGPR
ncbi:phosphotransferase family protein [Actinocorallia sp. A-T 12471]|uniref:phosphotransferase family protein n=1 Tax=Actinocorallia sp. A-T 12471 TaxID=3089813 RepID=UPI0029CBAC69|nr:phosphotransferase family protein [Actinocorallia sp. A-T 12471]MDX6742747.1 phosphotransferase family protein [Actinocorallia sp. A-T 12471]